MKAPRHTATTRGFSHAASLMQGSIRKATESRGFAVSRLLTAWAEIVGEAVASVARPVDISYARDGFGATLTLLTTGAQAPMLDMQTEEIRERVNACYGYNAISRVRITQTAPTGFSEGQVAFTQAPKPAVPRAAPITAEAREIAEGVGSAELRVAIEALAANVLSKRKS